MAKGIVFELGDYVDVPVQDLKEEKGLVTLKKAPKEEPKIRNGFHLEDWGTGASLFLGQIEDEEPHTVYGINLSYHDKYGWGVSNCCGDSDVPAEEVAKFLHAALSYLQRDKEQKHDSLK